MSNENRPAVLIVLDGFGHGKYDESIESNAIAAARKPVWDRLWGEYPNTFIKTSGSAVGLPGDQMGNSEVGHMNLGAGRVVYQEFTRVQRSVRTGSFYTNKTLTDPVDKVVASGKAIHIIGLLSPGGVHSHESHIHAMVKLAVERGAKKVYVHASLDGRDTPPKSAEESLRKLIDVFEEVGGGQIVNIIGRYYSMDRDHRWPRIKAAYDLMTGGVGVCDATDPLEALQKAYERGETDEFVQATCIIPEGAERVFIDDGDAVVFLNYRSDRARQITRTFIEPDFDGFERDVVRDLETFVSLTEYNSEFDIPVAFPPERLKNVFGEFISKLGLHQLRIAETEKYAHVTFFFNGGVEQPFEGEDRVLISSPDVATYDEQPEMSAPELTDKLVEAIKSEKYDTIIVNYANADMVGHTGNYQAAVKAIEALDLCLGRVLSALHAVGGEMLITADHGNAEQMLDVDSGQAHTAHTTNNVPLLYVGRPATLMENGALCDIAPSLLQMMGLSQPTEMTGHGLIDFEESGEESGE